MVDDDTEEDPLEALRYALWGEQDEATRRIRQATETDAGLDAEVEELRRIRDGMKELTAWKPTPDELARVRARLGAVERPDPGPRRYVAEPVFMAAGFRAAGVADRQFRIRTETYDADFHLFPTDFPGKFDLTGQLIRTTTEPARHVRVVLVADGVDALTASTDEFGEYRFQPAPARTLAVRIEDGEHIEDIQIWDQDKEEHDDQ